MEIKPQKSLIIIDPHLLISIGGKIPSGSLTSCPYAKFFICNHLVSSDFTTDDYLRIQELIGSEDIEQLPVDAVEMNDLLGMRNHLVLYQIASIAAARFYECSFASDCCILQRMARSVLSEDKVLGGSDIRRIISQI
ncbi:hypothetical protein [Armatimonas sp.]|uniref:hypothetical protein n=1 Tax=Armatimonas sp. TaxID=1872638 RepID=UPI00286D3A7A|nr:hypothetical protein [Armatimonas sp.]